MTNAANQGIIRPPLVYLCSIVGGLIVDFVSPITLREPSINAAFAIATLLGLALWVNSLWMLIALFASIGVMSLVVIPREERYLASRFPSEYAAYKAAVRRWL